jgi:Ca2+:H+ antiporter
VTRRLARNEVVVLAAAAALGALALLAELLHWGNTLIFGVSAIALMLLAWTVSVATEQLGESAGPKVGGILNATFGNAAELIIAGLAIRAGQIEVATASITGSILGNLLFVLGLSLLLGGLKNGIQHFDQRVAGMNASMLAIAVAGMALPTAFAHVGDKEDIRLESEITAGVLLLLYALMLVFYFRAPSAAGAHEAHAPHWPAAVAGAVLLGATVIVAWTAEIFVGTLEGIGEEFGLSEVFIGLVIVPIVGNIAEHLAGVRIAYKNNVDFSMAVSVGSSLQIALGVAPLLVFASLLTDYQFDMVFPPIEVLAIFVTVFITGLIAADGESNWLEGAQLVGTYAIIATVFWFL